MAESYSLGSKFGSNVTKTHTGENVVQAENNLTTDSGNLFSYGKNYDSYESVFNGEINHDINMYTRQAMIIGMNLRAADKNKCRFDTTI